MIPIFYIPILLRKFTCLRSAIALCVSGSCDSIVEVDGWTIENEGKSTIYTYSSLLLVHSYLWNKLLSLSFTLRMFPACAWQLLLLTFFETKTFLRFVQKKTLIRHHFSAIHFRVVLVALSFRHLLQPFSPSVSIISARGLVMLPTWRRWLTLPKQRPKTGAK